MPACGYPDAFNQPTMKLKITETYTLTPDAAGNSLMQIAPQLVNSVGYNTVTANVIQAATGSTPHPDYASVTAQCAWARTVCMGVQVDYIGAAMTASGSLTVILDNKPDYWVGAAPSTCVDDGDTRPVTEGRKFGMVPTQPSRFESDTTTSFMTPTFQSVFVMGTGLSGTTPVYRVTVVRHIEGLPLKAAAVARGSATRTTASPVSMVALSGIDTDTQSTASTWRSSLSAAASDAMSAVAAAAAPIITQTATDLAFDAWALIGL